MVEDDKLRANLRNFVRAFGTEPSEDYLDELLVKIRSRQRDERKTLRPPSRRAVAAFS